MPARVTMTSIVLALLLLSSVNVPQAQTTFVSPILNRRTWLPAYRVNYAPPRTSTKKGLAYTLHSGVHTSDATEVGASWLYCWWWDCESLAMNGVERVPMIDTTAAMSIPARGNSQWLMGPNELDLTDVTLGQAVMAWHAIEQSYPDKLLLSPAPSHLHPEWMLDFIEIYVEQYGKLPRLDALAVHCYLTEPQCEWRVRQFEDLADELDITGGVWVTEFAFADPNETAAFVRWMEDEPMIARYAIFVNRMDAGQWREFALMDDAGGLTSMGRMYAALPR